MKMKVLTRFSALTVIMFVACAAHATIITTNALWTFEVSQPTTSGPHAPEFGSGQAIQFGATTITSPLGNGSAQSFSGNQWNTGEYFQFRTTTLGHHSIKLEWDQTRSATGPDDFTLQYSTDGLTFFNFANYVVLENSSANGGTWNASTRISNYTFNYDLSAITALNDQPNVYFRLTTSDNPGGAGTSRVDNFLVTSSMIPEPSTVLLLTVGGVLVWRRARSGK